MSNPESVLLKAPGALRGRRVTVVGLAREGIDLARFLMHEGADVLVTDAKPAESLGTSLDEISGLDLRLALGGHPLETCLDAAVVFVSPGVPPEIPLLVEARRRGITVSSSTRLFFERCPAPIIGITGSSGKTTTTTLVGLMLETAGRRVFVGGNIGVPLLGRLREIDAESWVVLELSSFQLEPMDVSPHVAAITNLTPNHLDRHPSMEAYVAAKANIIRHQRCDDWSILNADDPVSRGLEPTARVLRFSLAEEVEGAFLDRDALVVRLAGVNATVCHVNEVRLRGRHNLANLLTACAMARAAGVGVEPMRAVARSFAGVRHRLELVTELANVRYFNDSIATSPERSMAGLAAFDGEPIILLAGGRDKHLPMDEWGRRIATSVRQLVLFGEAAPLIERAARSGGMAASAIHHVANVSEAVRRARTLARAGDVVLLSPGGTSFDQYSSFEERGEDFATAVRTLAIKVANER